MPSHDSRVAPASLRGEVSFKFKVLHFRTYESSVTLGLVSSLSHLPVSVLTNFVHDDLFSKDINESGTDALRAIDIQVDDQNFESFRDVCTCIKTEIFTSMYDELFKLYDITNIRLR